MKTAIGNRSKQVFCWIILLQIVNISIHPLHPLHLANNPFAKSESRSINEINSVYELIAEGVFHLDVPETGEDEIDASSPPFELYLSVAAFEPLPPVVSSLRHVDRYRSKSPLIFKEPHSPPPKVVA